VEEIACFKNIQKSYDKPILSIDKLHLMSGECLIIKVKDNAFCTFCQEDEETIEHLFWNCEIVQAFIDEIDSWLWY
jgi:hypothetical protein